MPTRNRGSTIAIVARFAAFVRITVGSAAVAITCIASVIVWLDIVTRCCCRKRQHQPTDTVKIPSQTAGCVFGFDDVHRFSPLGRDADLVPECLSLFDNTVIIGSIIQTARQTRLPKSIRYRGMKIWIIPHGCHPLNAILLSRHRASPRPQPRLRDRIRGFKFHIHCLQWLVELSVVDLEYGSGASTMHAQHVTAMPCTPADSICRLSAICINQQYSPIPTNMHLFQHCFKVVQHIVLVVRARLACRHRKPRSPRRHGIPQPRAHRLAATLRLEHQLKRRKGSGPDHTGGHHSVRRPPLTSRSMAFLQWNRAATADRKRFGLFGANLVHMER